MVLDLFAFPLLFNALFTPTLSSVLINATEPFSAQRIACCTVSLMKHVSDKNYLIVKFDLLCISVGNED